MLIAQITDLHIAADGPGLGLVDTAARLAEAVDFLEAMTPAPDAVVVTGDLVNDGTDAEYERLVSIIGPLRSPLFVLPGNHDNPARLAAAFPDHRYLGRGPAGTYDFVADLGEVALVGLDTAVRGQAHGAVGQAQLAWLDATLERLHMKPVLIAMHHPPFETGIWWMDAMGLEGAGEFAEVLARHDNCNRVICGHIHRAITTNIGGAVVSVARSIGQQIRLDLDGAAAGVTDEEPQIAMHLWTGHGWISHDVAFGPARRVDIGRQWVGFDAVASALQASGPSARRPAPADR